MRSNQHACMHAYALRRSVSRGSGLLGTLLFPFMGGMQRKYFRDQVPSNCPVASSAIFCCFWLMVVLFAPGWWSFVAPWRPLYNCDRDRDRVSLLCDCGCDSDDECHHDCAPYLQAAHFVSRLHMNRDLCLYPCSFKAYAGQRVSDSGLQNQRQFTTALNAF